MSESPSEGTERQGGQDGHLTQAVAEIVTHPQYPCLGARSVFQRNRASVRVYGDLADPLSAPVILRDLREFAANTDHDGGFASFMAIFRGPVIDDERHFERLLWAQLRQIHEVDDVPWNEDVSADPEDEHFAFSAGGTAYFIVGLHPQATREARVTPVPTLVFNLHEQFEILRRSGTYAGMRDKIRERDERLQGTINPMVADHGASSEARQYSGRRVGPTWRAPFPIDQVDADTKSADEPVAGEPRADSQKTR